MLSNMRNEPGEGPGNSRSYEESYRQNSYEGFEGMNYEQIRQPYQPREKDQGNDITTNKRGPQQDKSSQ